MTREKATERAWTILVTHMPHSWLEMFKSDGTTQPTPKAIRLRDTIGESLMVAYRLGQKDPLHGEQGSGEVP